MFQRQCVAIAILAAAGVASAADSPWQMPRTPWGTPDLQGTWTNASLTSLERDDMFKGKATLSDAEAAEFERTNAFAQFSAADAKPTDPSVKATATQRSRRLQRVLARPRHAARDVVKGEAPHVVHRRAGERQGAVHARRAEGISGRARRHELRRSGESRARRALPARLRLDQRPADAAGRLQQQLPDRAVAGRGDDPRRDGSRRARRAHERQASAAADHAVDGRFDRPLGRRHAGGRDHEPEPGTEGALRHQAALLPAADRQGDRALHARRRERDPLPVHGRGQRRLHAAVEGRSAAAPRRRTRSTNTPATKATTRCRASSRARGSRRRRGSKKSLAKIAKIAKSGM